MPTISAFYGILIQMFWKEHGPPHFHAIYAEFEVLVDLRDLTVLQGALPNRAMTLVIEWATQHRDELMEDWDLCRAMQPPKVIEPLP